MTSGPYYLYHVRCPSASSLNQCSNRIPIRSQSQSKHEHDAMPVLHAPSNISISSPSHFHLISISSPSPSRTFLLYLLLLSSSLLPPIGLEPPYCSEYLPFLLGTHCTLPPVKYLVTVRSETSFAPHTAQGMGVHLGFDPLTLFFVIPFPFLSRIDASKEVSIDAKHRELLRKYFS